MGDADSSVEEPAKRFEVLLIELLQHRQEESMHQRKINMKYFRAVGILKKLYWMLKFDVWSISSKLHPDENIKVIFVSKGNEIDKNYYRSLIFTDNYDENYLGKVWVWSLIYYFWRFRKSHDLIIVKTKMQICNLFRSKKRFVIPSWISCEIDLGSDLKSQSISKHTFKNNVRKIKKSNFGYTITKDPLDFNFFYHNMYLPYLSNRHGNLGLEFSLEGMKKSFESGELLMIKDGEEVIAGVLIDYIIMNGIPRTTLLGVLDGDFHYVEKGALIAISYYTIEYLRKRNYKKLGLGGARPFINDGLLNQKLSWGADIVCETPIAFLLCILSHKKCLKTFLSNNPFICKVRNGLSLATFSKSNSKEDKKFSKYRKKLN